ncbi:6-phosphofructokinase [Anaerosporobacter faecicola]|uniref:6-phosphofructokinase n=1 Tax=Anaerosporobacter faecicola TaxID=2718714 RepID=UPI00143A4534|nr:6-phosphofructokinase [Anaerosporobacter faecicola]
MSLKINCLIAQSGGPTTAINSSLAGVIHQAIQATNVDQIYGSLNGIQGVLKDDLVNLTSSFEDSSKKLMTLIHTPSMFLGSCRYKLADPLDDDSDYHTIFQQFLKYNIKYFFYIGGNDSMDTVDKLSAFALQHHIDIQIIGIPKTIDNDLSCIDHTPGFGSAAKYIASSMLEIAHDTYIYDTKSVTIVEIMGRNAGWLTAASALARTEYSDAPHLIYLPETPFSTSAFVQDVRNKLKDRKHVIVAVSEGIKDLDGQYISANSTGTDQFGHVMLSGTGKYLEILIRDTIGCKVRSIELNVLQRCASHISSQTDLDEAYTLGKEAFLLAAKGETAKMVTLTRTSNDPYTVSYSNTDVSNVANVEKQIPKEWITSSGNDITKELLDYLYPLIQGEVPVTYKDGVPAYLPVTHLFR